MFYSAPSYHHLQHCKSHMYQESDGGALYKENISEVKGWFLGIGEASSSSNFT